MTYRETHSDSFNSDTLNRPSKQPGTNRLHGIFHISPGASNDSSLFVLQSIRNTRELFRNHPDALASLILAIVYDRLLHIALLHNVALPLQDSVPDTSRLCAKHGCLDRNTHVRIQHIVNICQAPGLQLERMEKALEMLDRMFRGEA